MQLSLALMEGWNVHSVPVVFMTAKSMPAEVARLVAAGAAAVIAKSFDPLKLGTQLLDIWHTETAADC